MAYTQIGRGFKLEAAAAASFLRCAAIRPGLVSLINSAYRTLAEQAALRKAWEVSHVVFASLPGESKHNYGLAVDIDSKRAPHADWQWFVTHGPAHGFRRTNSAEAWHFEFFKNEDLHVGGPTPPTPIERNTPMFGLTLTTTGKGYAFTGHGATLLTQQEWNLLVRLKKRNDDGTFANPATDPFLDGEIALMATALKRIAPTTTATIDPAALTAAIAAALPEAIDNSDDVAAKVVDAIKALTWKTT